MKVGKGGCGHSVDKGVVVGTSVTWGRNWFSPQRGYWWGAVVAQVAKAGLCRFGENLACQAEQLGLATIDGSSPWWVLSRGISNMLGKPRYCPLEFLLWDSVVELPEFLLEVRDVNCCSDTDSKVDSEEC